MLVEEEILDFEPALLEEPGFPWRGLVGSLVVHSIIVPLLAIGIQQVKQPQLTDEQMRIASVLKRQVIILRLPAELMKKRILPKEPERLKVEVKTAPVESAKAARKVVKAFLMPAAKPRLETSAAMILQPLVLTMQPAKLPEMEMPTITMVSPTPPKKRIVFDVGSLQKKPSMPKIVDPGPLPEPPQIMVSSAPIRPLYTGVVNPKLPVYVGPPSMQTIEVKDKSSFSAGGPVVEAPTNLVMISSKPVPARDIVSVSGVIAMPKGGIGTGNLEDGKAIELKAGMDAKGSASGTAKLETDARGGSGAILPDFATLVQIVHPSNGRNEVIIVQSGVDHIVPAARSLLEGDPVYTLYLNVGWTKEWVMHFCVPRVAPVGPKQVGGVVSLSSPPELKAPFAILTKVPPQRLVPPVVIAPGTLKPKPSPMVFYGYLDEKGKFSRMKKDGEDPSGFGDKVLKSLELWELRPATRGGGPTRVQIILVVPVD